MLHTVTQESSQKSFKKIIQNFPWEMSPRQNLRSQLLRHFMQLTGTMCTQHGHLEALLREGELDGYRSVAQEKHLLP